MAAFKSRGMVPNQRRISPTPFSTMRLTVPRHPAWKTPTASSLRIDQNDWQAIGGLDAEKNAGCVGDKSVATKVTVRGLRNVVDEVGVNLAKRDQRPGTLPVHRCEFLHKRRAIAFDGSA